MVRFGLCLGLAAVLTVPRAAQACTCAPHPTPAVAADGATAIFEGRVVEIHTEGATERRFVFAVSRVFKGDVDAQVSVFSSASPATCGRNYEVDKPYIVYAATGGDDQLRDHLCSRSRPTQRAGIDLEFLGPGVAVRPKSRVSAAPGVEVEAPRIEPAPQLPSAIGPKTGGCHLPTTSKFAALWLLLLAPQFRRRRPNATTAT